MVVLIARYQVSPGNAEQVLAELEEMATYVGQDEPGCLRYQVCRSVEDPNLLVLYEAYADHEAFQAHRETAHFQRIIEGRVAPMLHAREREVLEPVIG